MHRPVRIALLAVVAWLVTIPTAVGATRATPSTATLLARYAPVLVLHPAEQLRPSPVDGFLADSDLQRRTAAGWETIPGPLPNGGADLRLDQRACRASDGVAATQCYASTEATHGAAPVVYGAALRSGSRIALQYWIWYPSNPYSPTVPPGELWQVHEGDWEAVSVIVDLRGKPLLVGYSQHSKGKRRVWARVPKQGLHPVSYVALGSHANYFTAGVQPFDPQVVDQLLISVIRQNGGQAVDHTGRGLVVRPRVVRLTPTTPSWMTFAGRFGESEYLHVPGGQPADSGGGGPRGPAFHRQWRAPIAEVLSWPTG
ncbi:MAG TPA: Vps62-related protein [Gemmatimonadaceae bacterium]|nr:Vps62-related protein [Gemmatimonadaceae bacterium]